MDEFSLVPRAPSALEKVEPGAKRIISGMVADTLALARPHKAQSLRVIYVDDDYVVLRLVSLIIRGKFKDVTIDTFQNGDKAWEELSRADPDLLITDLLNNNVPGRTPQSARLNYGICGYEILSLLARKNVKYPILVLSGSLSIKGYENRAREYAGPNLNVSFFKKPFTMTTIVAELSKYLGPSDES